MKRDMDLVRDILSQLAESDGEVDARTFVGDGRDLQLVAYHFQIMQEAGLIEANLQRAFGGSYVLAEAVRLTWEGNDFLASVSSNKVWAKVKSDIAKHSVDAPFSVIKQLAVTACMSMFGM